MAIEFAPGGDFPDVVDNLESAELLRADGSPLGSTGGALRRGVSVSEAETSRGEYTRSDAVWHFPDADFFDQLRPGDVIVAAAGDRWTILSASPAAGGGRVRCVARNLAIANGLDRLIDVERAVYEKDDRGAIRAVWSTWRSGLAAKIQSIAAKNTGINGQEATLNEYRVFLAEQLELDHTHRIKGPDGRLYKIVGYKKPERIDALMEIEAVRAT